MDSRDADRLHAVLAVLAPPRRFGLLLLLLSGVDRSVCQLARAVGLSQSCTTRHLQSPATVFVAPAPAVRGRRPKRRAAPRLSSDPGAASRSAARFAAREAAAERRPPGPIAAAGTPAPHADRESGSNSAPASPQPRFRQELEDYLL